jgi:oligopeptide/dipeptide ABC transporter ATP-binding protein
MFSPERRVGERRGLDVSEPSRGGPASAPLVEARALVKQFPVGRGLLGRPREWVHAVRGIDVAIHVRETLGVVGESGCGKSTLGRLLLRLLLPTSGEIWFDGSELSTLPRAELRRLRREMQIVFQDPYGSLNPRMRVGAIVAEGLEIHRLASGARKRDEVARLLSEVGLRPEHADRYPHEFSGGQRQRIGIARALAVGPRFLVCDEPVSALDVSVQAQVINLLADLQASHGLAYFFVAHDLRVVAHLSHRIAVMYLGQIVELAARDELLLNARHPYTRALLAAVPEADPARPRPQAAVQGDVPSPISPPSGCAFHPRCPFAEERCRVEVPALLPGANGHAVACHVFPAPLAARVEPALDR